MKPYSRITFEAIPDAKGGLRPANAPNVRARLAKWNGDRVMVIVSRGTIPKTASQLGYYFGLVVPCVAEHIGLDEEETHRQLKLAWGPTRQGWASLIGEAVVEPISLADATKEEMSAYLDKILANMATDGLYIPGPNENTDDPI